MKNSASQPLKVETHVTILTNTSISSISERQIYADLNVNHIDRKPRWTRDIAQQRLGAAPHPRPRCGTTLFYWYRCGLDDKEYQTTNEFADAC